MVLLEQLDEAGAATQPELRKATREVESLAIDDRMPDTAAAPDDARDAHTEQQQQQEPEEDGAFHDAADVRCLCTPLATLSLPFSLSPCSRLKRWQRTTRPEAMKPSAGACTWTQNSCTAAH
jgi:predicted ATPase